MSKLTKRQEEIYNLISEQIKATGAPPTRAEIAGKMGFKSPNAAEDHLRALARKGVLKLIPGTSRGIRLVNASIGIPVITNTKTNLPILHSQNINRYINIDPQTFNPTAEYVVQISDNSLSKIGILPNDLLLIHATHEIYCGQLVVAKVNDIPYIRRFYSKGDLIYLNTESEEFESKKCDINKDKISIEGIVVGSLREQITKLVQGPPNKSYEY